MKLRKELFDGYVLHKTIIGKFNYLGKQLHCYTELLNDNICFCITRREDNYTSPFYNTLDDAIDAWNKLDDVNF